PRPARSTCWSTTRRSRRAARTGSSPSPATPPACWPSTPAWSPAPTGARSPSRSSAMPDTLFVPEGDAYLPTDATLGPWGPQLLHGGPVSALCTTLMEDEGGDGFTTVRFSGDFVRPLAQQPLTFGSRVVREGRRLQLVEGELDAAGKLVARCSLLRLRPLPIELPDDAVAASPAAPPDRPEDFHRDPGNPDFPGMYFLGTGIELHTRQPGGFR